MAFLNIYVPCLGHCFWNRNLHLKSAVLKIMLSAGQRLLLGTPNRIGGGLTINAVSRRYAHQHRMIQVQLKADVPGLGTFGTVQVVSPGRMRNHLFPKGLANYVLKGAEVPVLTRPSKYSSTTFATLDLAQLKSKIQSFLPNGVLVIPRRTVHGVDQPDLPTSSSSTPIYGSVTSQDILHALASSLNITVPPTLSATVSGGKLKATGDYIVQLQLPKEEGSLDVRVSIRGSVEGVAVGTAAGNIGVEEVSL